MQKKTRTLLLVTLTLCGCKLPSYKDQRCFASGPGPELSGLSASPDSTFPQALFDQIAADFTTKFGADETDSIDTDDKSPPASLTILADGQLQRRLRIPESPPSRDGIEISEQQVLDWMATTESYFGKNQTQSDGQLWRRSSRDTQLPAPLDLASSEEVSIEHAKAFLQSGTSKSYLNVFLLIPEENFALIAGIDTNRGDPEVLHSFVLEQIPLIGRLQPDERRSFQATSQDPSIPCD